MRRPRLVLALLASCAPLPAAAPSDATSLKGGGSLTYQVCEAGSSVCSDSVTVIF